MTTARAILDRALTLHQSIVEMRVTYETAFARVLSHREQYESAYREFEQVKRALRSLEDENDAILKELRNAMKGDGHEESEVTEQEEADQGSGQVPR